MCIEGTFRGMPGGRRWKPRASRACLDRARWPCLESGRSWVHKTPPSQGWRRISNPVASDQFGDGPLIIREPRSQPSESRMVRCCRRAARCPYARCVGRAGWRRHDPCMSERFAASAFALNLPRARGPSVRETGRREQAGCPRWPPENIEWKALLTIGAPWRRDDIAPSAASMVVRWLGPVPG